jgi:hypothetical protein
MLFDTGAHTSIISEDLITDESFRTYLQSDENAPYTDHKVGAVEVDATIRFSNTDVQLSFLAHVLPLERMPNRFSGILLGQKTLIDRLQCHLIPRQILIAKGEAVPEGRWGDVSSSHIARDF